MLQLLIFFAMAWSLAIQEGCLAFPVWGQGLPGMSFSFLFPNLSLQARVSLGADCISECGLLLLVGGVRAPERLRSVWDARPNSNATLTFSQLCIRREQGWTPEMAASSLFSHSYFECIKL